MLINTLKIVLHAINSHVLTSTNPCINKAIHVLLLHGCEVLRIYIPGPSQNLTSSSVTCTVANAISWRQNKAISGVFKTFAGNEPLRAVIGTGKKNFSKHFLPSVRVTKCFYAIKAMFWYINICWVPREVLKPILFRLGVSTAPSVPSRC